MTAISRRLGIGTVAAILLLGSRLPAQTEPDQARHTGYMLMADRYWSHGQIAYGASIRGLGIRSQGVTSAFGIGVVNRDLAQNSQLLTVELGLAAVSALLPRWEVYFNLGAVGHVPLAGSFGPLLGPKVGFGSVVGLGRRVGVRAEVTRNWYLINGGLLLAGRSSWLATIGLGLVPRGNWRLE